MNQNVHSLQTFFFNFLSTCNPSHAHIYIRTKVEKNNLPTRQACKLHYYLHNGYWGIRFLWLKGPEREKSIHFHLVLRLQFVVL
jgi:hypothetical protein